MQNSVKLVQLMQKFMPWSHVRIFRNERIQSTPLDLNSCFIVLYSVWVHLLTFRNYMKLGAKWGELVQLMQKFVPQSRNGIFCNERTWSTPLDPKLMFWCIFVVFGCICQMFRYYVKLGAKRVELVQLMHKFVP